MRKERGVKGPVRVGSWWRAALGLAGLALVGCATAPAEVAGDATPVADGAVAEGLPTAQEVFLHASFVEVSGDVEESAVVKLTVRFTNQAAFPMRVRLYRLSWPGGEMTIEPEDLVVGEANHRDRISSLNPNRQGVAFWWAVLQGEVEESWRDGVQVEILESEKVF